MTASTSKVTPHSPSAQACQTETRAAISPSPACTLPPSATPDTGLTEWEEDRLAGLTLNERVKRELDRKLLAVGHPHSSSAMSSSVDERSLSLSEKESEHVSKDSSLCFEGSKSLKGKERATSHSQACDMNPLDTSRDGVSLSLHDSSYTQVSPELESTSISLLTPEPSLTSTEMHSNDSRYTVSPDNMPLASNAAASDVKPATSISPPLPSVSRSVDILRAASPQPSTYKSDLLHDSTNSPPAPASSVNVRGRVAGFESILHRPIPEIPSQKPITRRPPPVLPPQLTAESSHSGTMRRNEDNNNNGKSTTATIPMQRLKAEAGSCLGIPLGSRPSSADLRRAAPSAPQVLRRESTHEPDGAQTSPALIENHTSLSLSRDYPTGEEGAAGPARPPETNSSSERPQQSSVSAEESRHEANSSYVPDEFIPQPLQPMFTGPTDLDLLLARLDDPDFSFNGRSYDVSCENTVNLNHLFLTCLFKDLLLLEEMIGPACSSGSDHQASSRRQALMDEVPCGRIEVLRRRVTKDGRKKLKLALLGVVVDKCGICISQFKEGKEAALLPCKHV